MMYEDSNNIEFQSPSNRVNIPNQVANTAALDLLRRSFNPLVIGSIFQTKCRAYFGEQSAGSRVSIP